MNLTVAQRCLMPFLWNICIEMLYIFMLKIMKCYFSISIIACLINTYDLSCIRLTSWVQKFTNGRRRRKKRSTARLRQRNMCGQKQVCCVCNNLNQVVVIISLPEIKGKLYCFSRLLQLLLWRIHSEPRGLKHSRRPQHSCSCGGSGWRQRGNRGDIITWSCWCWGVESTWKQCCSVHRGLPYH